MRLMPSASRRMVQLKSQTPGKRRRILLPRSRACRAHYNHHKERDSVIGRNDVDGEVRYGGIGRQLPAAKAGWLKRGLKFCIRVMTMSPFPARLGKRGYIKPLENRQLHGGLRIRAFRIALAPPSSWGFTYPRFPNPACTTGFYVGAFSYSCPSSSRSPNEPSKWLTDDAGKKGI